VPLGTGRLLLRALADLLFALLIGGLLAAGCSLVIVLVRWPIHRIWLAAPGAWTLVLHAAEAGFLLAFLRRRRLDAWEGRPGPALFPRPRGPAIRRGLGIALLAVAISLAYLGGLWLIMGPALRHALESPGVEALCRAPLPVRVWGCTPAVFSAPLCEELFFRGCLFGSFQRARRPLLGALLSAAVFALCHMRPLLMPDMFVFGLLMAWLYRRTGSLAAPVAAHLSYNLICSIPVLLGMQGGLP
jgi:membrane protease YdiL (CAAX protease family)